MEWIGSAVGLSTLPVEPSDFFVITCVAPITIWVWGPWATGYLVLLLLPKFYDPITLSDVWAAISERSHTAYFLTS